MLFFWMVVTGTVGSGMDAIIPLFQQHAIDHFIADKTMQGVGGWLDTVHSGHDHSDRDELHFRLRRAQS